MLTAAPSRRRDRFLPLAFVIAILVILSVAVPFAALVTAPGLLIVGARTLRSSHDDSGLRTLGWLALLSGSLILALLVFVAVGLLAVGTSTVIESGAGEAIRVHAP
jgi:hypothetical protein